MQIQTKQGFTLVEVMIAVALTAVVLGLTYGMWQFFSENFQFTFSQSFSVDEVERVSAELVREIREMQDAENGAYALETVLDNELTFYADYDADGVAERLHYYVTNGVLIRGVVEPTGTAMTYDLSTEKTRVVTDAIANDTPLFVYYNGDWPVDTENNPLAPANRLLHTRLIGITLMIKTENIDSPIVTITKMTAIRALKTN